MEGVYDRAGRFAVAGSAYFDLGVEEHDDAPRHGRSFGTRRLLAPGRRGRSEDTFAAAVFRVTDGFGNGTRGSISGGATGQYRFDLPNHFSGLVHVASYGARANVAGVLRRDDVDAGRIGFYDSYPDPSARSQSAMATRTQLGLTLDRTQDDGSHTSASVWAIFSTTQPLEFPYTEIARSSRWVGRGDLIEQSNQEVGAGTPDLRSARMKPGPGLHDSSVGVPRSSPTASSSQNLRKRRRTKPGTIAWKQTCAPRVGFRGVILGTTAICLRAVRVRILPYMTSTIAWELIPRSEETHTRLSPYGRRKRVGTAPSAERD